MWDSAPIPQSDDDEDDVLARLYGTAPRVASEEERQAARQALRDYEASVPIARYELMRARLAAQDRLEGLAFRVREEGVLPVAEELPEVTIGGFFPGPSATALDRFLPVLAKNARTLRGDAEPYTPEGYDASASAWLRLEETLTSLLFAADKAAREAGTREKLLALTEGNEDEPLLRADGRTWRPEAIAREIVALSDRHRTLLEESATTRRHDAQPRTNAEHQALHTARERVKRKALDP